MKAGVFTYEWRSIETKDCRCKFKDYLKAIEIWLEKPHVLNRRVCTAQLLWRKEVSNPKLLHTFIGSYLKDIVSPCTKAGEIQDAFEQFSSKYCSNEDEDDNKLSDNGIQENEASPVVQTMECYVHRLLPRNRKRKIVKPVNEIIIIDHSTTSALFLPFEDVCADDNLKTFDELVHQAAYRILFDENKHRLQLLVGQYYSAPVPGHFARPSVSWLKDQLLPKLHKWATQSNQNPGNQFTSLVAMDEYSQLYAELKEKYGAKFVEHWTEVTDPQKYVYEDIAIATYILILWRDERKESGLAAPQSFIDMGCGNGLLVHILSCEGHRGKGIDVRRRKIWDEYGDETCLEETAITPSDENLFPDYDWLIGNHSDELTPWIPVIASRSSYDCRYFVLPCCFHDFNSKFARRNSNQGQYRAYLDFIHDVGKICGFEVLEDRLRIPSTKRICQVGKRRTYKPDKQAAIDKDIQVLIQQRCADRIPKRKQLLPSVQSNMDSTRFDSDDKRDDESTAEAKEIYGSCVDEKRRKIDTNCIPGCCEGLKIDPEGEKELVEEMGQCDDDTSCQWVQGFHAREKLEPVRNCATVSWDLREEIITKVALKLLEEDDVERSDKHQTWRRGGSLSLESVAKLLDKGTLKQLKQECGGLKTLLKNANQVFQVSGNIVHVRDWAQTDVLPATTNQSSKKVHDKELLFKTKLCWFYGTHPDGCPRSNETCPFAHGDAELRKRPNFKLK